LKTTQAVKFDNQFTVSESVKQTLRAATD